MSRMDKGWGSGYAILDEMLVNYNPRGQSRALIRVFVRWTNKSIGNVVNDDTAGRIHWSSGPFGTVALIGTLWRDEFLHANESRRARGNVGSQRAQSQADRRGAFAIAVFCRVHWLPSSLLRKVGCNLLFVVSLIAMIGTWSLLDMSGFDNQVWSMEISMFILMPLAGGGVLVDLVRELARSKGWIQ